MKPRNTLIVVALFALLFAYVYSVELNKTPEQLGTPTAVPPKYVFQLTASQVKSIQVRDLRAPREFAATRSDGNWQVVKPAEKPADNAKVETALGMLATLQASRVLTDVADLAPFGFVTATLELRFVMSDTTPYALTVGDKTPDNSDYYAVYTGAKQPVFIVSGMTIDSLKTWLDTPPYQPTPTRTATVTPIATATPAATGTASNTPAAPAPSPALPNIVPTVLPTEAATPKP